MQQRAHGKLAAMAGFAAVVMMNQVAAAATIPLGAVSGGIGVYYNSLGGELPSNQAYVRAQFGAANGNGAEFNFDATPLPGGGPLSWYSIFQVMPNQFGLDLVLESPSSDNSIPTPVLTAYDNGNNSLPGRLNAGPVTWAISGYTGPTNGPANAANQIINSLLRGGTGTNDGVTFTTGAVSQLGSVFSVAVSGELDADGLIHWYTPATPNSPLALFEMTGRYFFSGTLSYDSSTDANPLMDFYAGSLVIDAEVICGARYVATSGANLLPGFVPNTCRNPMTPCATVQHGVDVACAGDTVHVAAGTYAEQVSIGKAVSVLGAGAATTRIAPSSVSANTTSLSSGGALAVIVLAQNAAAVTLADLTVDGGPAAFNACAPGYVGVYFRNASGSVDQARVTNIFHPFAPGCQTQNAILAHSQAAAPVNLSVTDSQVDTYGKNGITCSTAGVHCTISGNTVLGRGPVTVPHAAQNGIQISSGAGGTISGNQVHAHFYSAMAPNTDFCATGILVFAPAAGTQVLSNVVDGNRCELYVQGDGVLLQGNEVEPASEFPLTLIGNGNSVSLNRVVGSNGSSAAVYVDGTGNAFSCNRVSGNVGGGFWFDSSFGGGSGSGAGAPNTLLNNAIENNGVGADATALDPMGAAINAAGNWWGCVGGPASPGCDTVAGNVDVANSLSAPPACLSCSSNAECDDGLACTGAESCNVMSGMCLPGTPVACGTDQCHDVACSEPTGSCVTTPKINGFACSDGDLCTTFDTCQAGVCIGSGGSDDDGDGYCNAQEIAAGCNPDDFSEIPPQANVYSGGRGSTGGEVLLTYNAPAVGKVTTGSDGSCGGAPLCSLVSHFCLSGNVGDPCAANADCAHTDTCRLVVNYAQTPDLALQLVDRKSRGEAKTSVAALFAPVTPGCSRKVDLPFAPGFGKTTLRLKASGTTNGKSRRDRDVIIYRE
ncbi:MAG: hypothetical protein ABI629_03745 [bacterium]